MGLFDIFKSKPVVKPEPEPVNSIHLKLNDVGIEFPVKLETFNKEELGLDEEVEGVESSYIKTDYSDFFNIGLYKKYKRMTEENNRSEFAYVVTKTYSEENEREIVNYVNNFFKVFGLDDFAFKTSFDTEDLGKLRSDKLGIIRIYKQLLSQEKIPSVGLMKKLNSIMVSIGKNTLLVLVNSPTEWEDE